MIRMRDEEKIRAEGMKLVEEFSEILAKIPETEETHYVIDIKNVTRKDDRPVRKREFSQNLRRILPRQEKGYIMAEKGVK